LLGRKHGLTCDHLAGAQVVLADGAVVDCDRDHEPDLFWALRGAGGGQFGVVTALRFDTVREPVTTRIEARWSGAALGELVTAWQAWAPDAPDELTVNLTLESDPGAPIQATLFGAATLEEEPTRELLREFFVRQAGVAPAIELRAGLPYHDLKSTFADPWVDRSWATARADGSGRVYPNFPDPALDDWAAAYHAGNYPRLVAVKNAYDPHRFFDFPQAI